MQTHDLSEWATVLGLCTGVTAVLLVPVRLALDHEPLDWQAARLALVSLLLAAALHLDPMTAPKKGAL